MANELPISIDVANVPIPVSGGLSITSVDPTVTINAAITSGAAQVNQGEPGSTPWPVIVSTPLGVSGFVNVGFPLPVGVSGTVNIGNTPSVTITGAPVPISGNVGINGTIPVSFGLPVGVSGSISLIGTPVPISGAIKLSENPTVNQGIGGGTNWGVSGLVTADFRSVLSTLNSTTTPLGASSTFTGTWEPTSGYSSITILMAADVVYSEFNLQFSSDGVTAESGEGISVDVGNNYNTSRTYSIGGDYVRLVFTNGGTPQSSFTLHTTFNYGRSPTDVRVEGAFPNGSTIVGASRPVLVGGTNGASVVNTIYVTTDGIQTVAGRTIVGGDPTTFQDNNPVIIAGVDVSGLVRIPRVNVDGSLVVNQGTSGVSGQPWLTTLTDGNGLPVGFQNQDGKAIVPVFDTSARRLLEQILLALCQMSGSELGCNKIDFDFPDLKLRSVPFDATPLGPVSPYSTVLPVASVEGPQFVIGGHPGAQTFRINYTAAQTNVAIIGPFARNKIAITRVMATTDKDNSANVGVVIGFGASSTPTTSGVVAAHPGIEPGGGFVTGDGSGILGVGSYGDALRITSEVPTGGSIDIVITYFLTGA